MHQQLDMNRLPRHVAIIMDGNGRWAKGKLRNRVFGHEEGANSVQSIADCCLDLGIPYLTLYAFSKENWHRPQMEVKALWQLLKRFLQTKLPELIRKEIRLRHLGDLEGIPDEVAQKLQSVMEQTARFDKLVLSLAVNYGGRQEIVRAAVSFAEAVLRGEHRPDDLSLSLFPQYLFTADLPDPDLVIRTGGEYRVSNFLLWQLAYAELYVTDILWPEFRESEFMAALEDYQRRERRFGKTGDQVREALSLAP